MVEMVARDPTGRQTEQRGGASNKKMSVCFLGLLGLSLEFDGAMRESPRRQEETRQFIVKNIPSQNPYPYRLL